jgi:hypothetical protein
LVVPFLLGERPRPSLLLLITSGLRRLATLALARSLLPHFEAAATLVDQPAPPHPHLVDVLDPGPPQRLDHIPQVEGLAELDSAVGVLVQWRLGAQYARIAERAPHLLCDALAALHHSSGADRLRAAQLLAVTARSADAVAYKFGHRDLSARLVELMRWAAQQTEDRIAQATAA